MKFQKRILASLVLASAVFFVSCEENSVIDPNPTGPIPMAPTGVQVSTRSNTSIAVRWTKATGDTVVATGYEVIAQAGPTATPITRPAAVGDSLEFVFTGLTEGVVYDFTVKALSGTRTSAASAKVLWAPAKRTTMSARMYVSSSSLGSGLNLATGESFTIADGDKWDICLDDKDNNLLVGSPGVSGYVNNSFQFPNGKDAKIVRIRNVTKRATSLDEIWETSSLGNALDSSTFKEQLFDLGTFAASDGGLGFVVGILTATNTLNYAKVLVKSNGVNFVQGSGTGRYIDVEVSYQSAANTPYALTKLMNFGGERTTSNTIRTAKD